MATKISWVVNPDGTQGETWNPTVGCTPAGEGCVNCYAKSLHDKRHKAYGEGKLQDKPQYAQPFSEVQLREDRLDMPSRWRKPRTVFADSVSDLFHTDVPDEFIDRVFDVCEQCENHIFIILTKRPERMRQCLDGYVVPISNIYLGASVSTQKEVDATMPTLAELAKAGWETVLSVEPLLGPVRLSAPLGVLSQVIVGCESGACCRPCQPWWISEIVAQCKEARMPCFVKQVDDYGKVITDPKQFPESLCVRQLAWGPEDA